MHQTRPRYQGSSTRPDEQSLDDWLGDISDDDWSENAAERADRRRAAPAYQEPVHEGDVSREATTDRLAPDRPVATAEAHRAVIERRRLVAGLVLVVALGLAVVIPVVVLRGGDEATVTPVPEPATTAAVPSETGPSSAPTTPSTSSSATTEATTPSTSGTSTFALPEGTKLQLGEGDPAVIRELQLALSRAGYDPGPADGTFGHRTEAAVVAFQRANGLSVDGRVGPETAAALNRALASG